MVCKEIFGIYEISKMFHIKSKLSNPPKKQFKEKFIFLQNNKYKTRFQRKRRPYRHPSDKGKKLLSSQEIPERQQ